MILTPDDVVTLSAQTLESLDATINSSVDPTGTPPEFALVADVPDGSTIWTPGAWVGAWANGIVRASTPLIGAGATAGFTLTAGARYRVWVRYTAGGETPVQPVGSIRVIAASPILAPLATLNDLEQRLGKTITDPERATAALADVSAVVRLLAGQTISLATTTVELTPDGTGAVRLQEHPIVSVDNVTDGATTLAYTNTGSWLNASTWGTVTVTYTHGYDPVPPVVVAVVCQIAGRALTTPPSATGVRQESLGSYSYSLGSTSEAGPFGVLVDERRIIEGFRRPAPPIPMVPSVVRYVSPLVM